LSVDVKGRGWDWGPKYFRFNNYWLKNRGLIGVVEESWRNQNVSGWMGFVLKENLKELKNCLKDWYKVEYGGMVGRTLRLVDDIKIIYKKGEVDTLNDFEVQRQK